jgi:DNA invertase Pin-like site-specific DNA recombinase
VEVIGAYSNRGHLCKKFADLRKCIQDTVPRPPLLYQERTKTRSKRFLNDADIDEIGRRYEAGETTQQVGTRYGISKTRVATILRAHGIKLRRQGLSDKQVSKAVKLYASGNSLAVIGKQLGLSPTTIGKALTNAGVKMRDTHSRER